MPNDYNTLGYIKGNSRQPDESNKVKEEKNANQFRITAGRATHTPRESTSHPRNARFHRETIGDTSTLAAAAANCTFLQVRGDARKWTQSVFLLRISLSELAPAITRGAAAALEPRKSATSPPRKEEDDLPPLPVACHYNGKISSPPRSGGGKERESGEALMGCIQPPPYGPKLFQFGPGTENGPSLSDPLPAPKIDRNNVE